MEGATHFVEIYVNSKGEVVQGEVYKIEFLQICLETTKEMCKGKSIVTWRFKYKPVPVLVVDEINDVRVTVVEEIK